MEQIPGGPSGWLAYVQVDDIHATTQKAKSLGADVMKEVTEVMGMGRLSFIRGRSALKSLFTTLALTLTVHVPPDLCRCWRISSSDLARLTSGPHDRSNMARDGSHF